MKKITLALFASLLSFYVFGQGSGNKIEATGNVGIGTTDPKLKLHVEDGEVGIGDYSSDNWLKLFQLKTDDYGYDIQHNNASVLVNEQGTTNEALILGDVDNGNNSVLFGISHKTGENPWEPKLTLTGSGRLGLGTSSPMNKLHIENGDLRITNDEGTGGDGKASIIFSEASNEAKAHARITYHGDDVDGQENYLGFGLADDASKDFSQMVIKRTGNVGIGITDPNVKLVVNGAMTVGKFNDPTHGKIMIKGDGAGQGLTVWNESGATTLRLWADAETNMGFLTRGDNAEKGIALGLNGNIGIGTTKPKEKLSVNGTILAKEIVVSTKAEDWPDYVFEDEYPLRKLSDVESFIKVNKHLPDMPSADEIAKEGARLAEMNKRLLQKVEELTLYLIEKDKEVKGLNEKVLELNRTKKEEQLQREKLEERLAKIEALLK